MNQKDEYRGKLLDAEFRRQRAAAAGRARAEVAKTPAGVISKLERMLDLFTDDDRVRLANLVLRYDRKHST